MTKKPKTDKDSRQIDLEDWLKVGERMHEVYLNLHKALEKDGVTMQEWNKAQDARINDILAASGIDVPSKYKSMTTEQVYNELKKENDNDNH
jgi:hypothetical protein